MSHQIQFLLAFYFSSQVFLVWQVTLVFCSEHLVVFCEGRVSCHIRIGLGAKDDADGRVVIWSFFHLVIHLQVHVHLTDILVGDAIYLQVDQDKRFDEVIVKYQVDIVVILLGSDMLLASHERIPFSHFHQEFFEVVDDGCLQF